LACIDRDESKRFFFEKKKQKTFANFDRAGFTTWAQLAKVFWLLFFKKVTASFPP
jgi:hypothetical protein